MEVGMKKLAGVIAGFVVVIGLCTFIVAQDPGGVDNPNPKPTGGMGLPEEVDKDLKGAIDAATEKLADLGKKKIEDSNLEAVLKETLAATKALEEVLIKTKDPAMKDMINQLIKELTNIKELVELTKREYNWSDIYGCPNYNKRRVDDSLRKIDEILKKLGGGGK
jgi:hypothetical protein